MTQAFDRGRARLSIMNFVLSFCITYESSDGRLSPSIHGFRSTWSNIKAEVGDLVILQSCGPNKWQIGWLVEITTLPHDIMYTVESLDDGSLCNWTNVGISYLNREIVAENPRWRWTDRQFAFASRWSKTCRHQENGQTYIEPKFQPDGSVMLRTRTRWSNPSEITERSFPDWKKVTKAIMAECYAEIVAEHERSI